MAIRFQKIAVATVIITLSPIAALAAGVSVGASPSVGVSTSSGASAGGANGGVLGTGIGARTTTDVNTNVSPDMGTDANSQVRSRTATSTGVGANSDTINGRAANDIQSNTGTHVNDNATTNFDMMTTKHKKQARDASRTAVKASSATDVNGSLSTNPSPSGTMSNSVNTNVGTGVEARTPGTVGR